MNQPGEFPQLYTGVGLEQYYNLSREYIDRFLEFAGVMYDPQNGDQQQNRRVTIPDANTSIHIVESYRPNRISGEKETIHSVSDGDTKYVFNTTTGTAIKVKTITAPDPVTGKEYDRENLTLMKVADHEVMQLRIRELTNANRDRVRIPRNPQTLGGRILKFAGLWGDGMRTVSLNKVPRMKFRG